MSLRGGARNDIAHELREDGFEEISVVLDGGAGGFEFGGGFIEFLGGGVIAEIADCHAGFEIWDIAPVVDEDESHGIWLAEFGGEFEPFEGLLPVVLAFIVIADFAADFGSGAIELEAFEEDREGFVLVVELVIAGGEVEAGGDIILAPAEP